MTSLLHDLIHSLILLKELQQSLLKCEGFEARCNNNQEATVYTLGMVCHFYCQETANPNSKPYSKP